MKSYDDVHVSVSREDDYIMIVWVGDHPVRLIDHGIEYIGVIGKKVLAYYWIKEIDNDHRRED